MVRFEEPKSSSSRTVPDAPLFQLAATLHVAEQTHDEAMVALAQAEQRFADLPEEEKHSRRRPTWLVAAQERETSTGNALEIIYGQIARTPAETRIGLSIKIQMVILLCGESADETELSNDMVLVLLHSLLTDCREH